MKKLIICAAVVCLLLAGCVANHPTSTHGSAVRPGVTGTQAATKPTTTIPGTDAPNVTVPPVTTVPESSVPQKPVSYIVYTPNETFDGFNTTNATMNALHPQGIMITLIAAGAVESGASVNSAVLDGTQLNLDLNQAFLDQLVSMGNSGEKVLIGSIVNTFLSAYDCETVLLTVNGEAFDSGHATYDSPLSFVE